MEAQGADPSALPLETALRELRDAIELREAEHARRNRDRVLFSRGVTLFFLGIILGLVLLGRVFNLGIFRERVYEQIQADAPSVVRHLRDSLTELAGMNRTEVNRSLPVFAGTLASAVQTQADVLRPIVSPLAANDPAALLAAADRTFAQHLRERFPEAHLDEAQARELQDPSGLHEARAALSEVSRSLHALGPSSATAFQDRETAEALSNASMETIREKMLAGELGLAVADTARERDQ
jgi:hypothetical protein